MIRSVRGLLAEGGRYLVQAVRGRAPALGVPFSEFAWAVLWSLRPHYFVFPGAAALAGAAAATRTEPVWKIATVAGATALSWGIGQLINDLVDVEADRVDAPHRAGVRGLLPEGPTVAVAILLGIVVTIAVAIVGPLSLSLLAVSALLLLVYQPAKTIPGLGNLAHGALMGSVAALGYVTAAGTLRGSAGIIGVVALWAAVYLEANYEKDAAGDRVAGYRTLAHMLDLRGSAILRLLAGFAGLWLARVFFTTQLSLGFAVAAAVALFVSVVLVLTTKRVLLAYRFAVHSTTLGLTALAAPLLGNMNLVFLGVALLLTEHAFFTSKNP